MRMEDANPKLNAGEDAHLHHQHLERIEDVEPKLNAGEDTHPHHQWHLKRMEDDDNTEFDFFVNDESLIVAEAKKLEQAWTLTTQKVQKQMQLLASLGTIATSGMADAAKMPQTNALFEEGEQATMRTVQEWKDQFQALQMSSRNVNVQAKKNINHAILSEREQLLSGGQDDDLRRRQLQTQAGMASSAEDITEGLRRSRQRMIQELEQNKATLSVLDQSNATLRKADAEFKGQHSTLSETHSKITSLMRENFIERVVVIFLFSIFLSVCFYIAMKRSPVFKDYVRESLGLSVHQPPPMIPPPPFYSPSSSKDSFSPGGGHPPDLYESVPESRDHQGVQYQLPGAPEFVLHTDARAYDPQYHEEL